MKVFKFGGASVNSADSIHNAANILEKFTGEKILVVISAMGKTTNALELLLEAYLQGNLLQISKHFQQIKDYHLAIIEKLFGKDENPPHSFNSDLFNPLELKLKSKPSANRDYEYDQIVSFGEIISTQIVSTFLNHAGISNSWLDARNIIKTNHFFRQAEVNWATTLENVDKNVKPLFKQSDFVITQGFIASTPENITTTLGREGSDYSAAIFAYCLGSENVTIWKDVPGLLNADPKYFPKAIKLEKIPYKEAIELAYYGASIIHPKTIKPLENKQIPLYVKSFVNPDDSGSVIRNTKQVEPLIPSYIFKFNQILISILPKDFSFIAENNLCEIFEIFGRLRIKINVLQNSAISFSVCIDNDLFYFDTLLAELEKKFNIRYNTGLELITIRHYSENAIKEITDSRKILLEQRSRLTAQFVVNGKSNLSE